MWNQWQKNWLCIKNIEVKRTEFYSYYQESGVQFCTCKNWINTFPHRKRITNSIQVALHDYLYNFCQEVLKIYNNKQTAAVVVILFGSNSNLTIERFEISLLPVSEIPCLLQKPIGEFKMQYYKFLYNVFCIKFSLYYHH